jgi:hypothetical protein
MFDGMAQVARADFDQAEEAGEAGIAVERLLTFLAEHAEHEDREILPELTRLCPELAADLQADHSRIQGFEQEVAKLVLRLRGATGVERRSLGRRIHEKLGTLVAHHLLHMEREEVQAHRVLWANRSDDELGALHERIVGAIAPARVAEWMKIILPALNGAERAALVAQAGAAS